MAALSARFLLIATFMFLPFIRVTRHEKVKIVEEPAVYRSGQMSNYYQPARHFSKGDNKKHACCRNYVAYVSKLSTRVKPSLVSGPPHLHVLAGKCFPLIHNGYKYEFCPFQNVTQKEQTVRWNAFAGVLGVWKEWVIVNNTFEAMLFANGDMCPGEKPRQTKVLLRCGDNSKVISVVEPTICHYELRFETPLACPIDAFLVYPVLSAEGQKEWQQIEEALYREELTLQGYNKYRQTLFQKENLIPYDNSNKEKQKDEKDIKTTAPEGDFNSHAGNSNAEKSSSFHSKEGCSKAYSDLLAEVQRLRKLLNVSCSGSNDSIDAHTNRGVQSNKVLKNNFTGVTSNKKEILVKQNQNISNLQRTLIGEEGNKQKAQTKTLETRATKGFQSIVENLRGDPGVKRNESIDSSDSKQRKSDIFMNANNGS